MQTQEYFLPENMVHPLANEAMDAHIHAPLASSFDAFLPPGMRQITPFERFNLQPSEACPKNFVIFDQTDQQSRIMFHPAMTYKFHTPDLNGHATCSQDFEKKKVVQMERELSPPFEEDPNDIDALMSVGADETEDDFDEEEISTARTHENYDSLSDTCSSYCSKSRKKRSSSSSVHKSSGARDYCHNEGKCWEMKRMVRILKKIVPSGGNQMDSVAVLDEAVNYLKSLKVEVEQYGIEP